MAITQISKIQNKRGEMDVDRTGLPVLAPGELGYATNRNRLFVGNVGASSPVQNTEVLTQASLGPTLNYNVATGKVDAVGGGGGGTGTSYTIESAAATPSGANLRLVGSDSTVDSVRFAASGSITVTSTDGNTITIGGGGETAAGSNKSVQYNSSGSFAGTSTFLFDSTSSTLTIGDTSASGDIIIDGSNATIKTTNSTSSITVLPGADGGSLIVGSISADSTIAGGTGSSLSISADTTLYLQSSNSDVVVQLSATTSSKITLQGPSATQYATGLVDNDLVNKKYVDTVLSTGVTQIVAGTGISVDPTTGTGSVTISVSGGSGITGPSSSTNRSIASWNGTTGSGLYDNPNVGITSDGKLSVGDFYIYNGTYTGGSKQNIAIGNYALGLNTAGQNNIAIGFGGPLAANTTGEYNIAIGSGAMNDNLIGNYNVAVGTNAIYALADTGHNFNTAVGHEAGVNLFSGSGNTILGSIQGPSSMNDTVLLAAGLNKQRLRINESGAWSFTNPYNAESLDYGATGTVLVSAGASAHPNWKPALSKQISYTELTDPVYFAPAVAGQVIKKNAGTIEANTGTCTADDFFMVYNTSNSTNMAINQGTGFTLRQAGTTNTGNRTLAPYGFARVWFVSSTEAVISGDGIS